METCRRTQDGNGGRSGDGNERSTALGNVFEDGNGDGDENGIGEGGGHVKKRKKSHKSCRRDVRNGGDLGGKNKINRRQERVGSVAANSDNEENSKEAGGEHKIPR